MKKRILILDDNPINNRKYIDPLKEKFQVDVTLRMKSATRLIKTKEYDVIVIDIMMPSQFLKDNNEMMAGFNYYDEEISINNYGTYFGNGMFNGSTGRIHTAV